MSWHYLITDDYGWTNEYSADQQDNASEIWNTLVTMQGWTEEAAAAVLGNFQYESFLNPAQWEIGGNYSYSYGTGLGQWTPATKISDYVGSRDKDKMAEGAKQMMYFVSHPEQYSTYYLNPDGSSTYYNESGLPYITNMDDFSHSTATVEELTRLWAITWERPSSSAYNNSKSERIRHADHWYNIFHGSSPVPPTPPEPPMPSDVDMWMLIYYFLAKVLR